MKCFWIMEREYTPQFPAESVTPDAFIELILNFGTRISLTEKIGFIFSAGRSVRSSHDSPTALVYAGLRFLL